VLEVTPLGGLPPPDLAGNDLLGPVRLTVWVDKRTFLPLRTEVRDAAGSLRERTEATVVEYDVALPPTTFVFTPPAGVPVFTYSGGSGADVKRSLAEQPAQALRSKTEPTPGRGSPKRP
jgi:hypothetical protein